MTSTDYSIKDLDKVVNLEGKVKNAKVSRLTAPGENYLSLVLRVDIELENNGYSEVINSVAKCLPSGGFDLYELSMKNEIIWYSKIAPILKEFGEQNGITVTYIPEHYGSRFSLDASKTEPDIDAVLLLENLIPKGYQNDDRYRGLDFNTSKATLKQLAIFHALPIVMKRKRPELFEIIKDYLEKCRPERFGPLEIEEPVGPPGNSELGGPPDLNGPRAKKLEEIFVEELSKRQQFAPYLSKLKHVLEKPMMALTTFTNMAKEPWNTITHNDFWVNNFMVNFREGKETLVKIVDYQLCLYGSFTRDLLFFLLTSVNNDVFKVHLDDLLRFYYEEFTSILRKTEVDYELSYEEYLGEIRKSAIESEMGHAMFFSTVLCGNKEKDSVENLDPFSRVASMTRNMSQLQEEKLLLIASEAAARKWM